MNADAYAKAGADADADADTEADADAEAKAGTGHIRAVRLGHGANCSSVGSVVDTLFLSAAVGGAIFAALCAAMAAEPIKVVGPDDANERRGEEEDDA